MRTQRKLTGAAIATALLIGAGPVLASPAAAAPPAAAAALATAPAPFTAAEAHLAPDGGYTLSWSSPSASVTVTAVTDPTAAGGTVVGTSAGSGSLAVPAGTLPAAERWYFRLTPDSGTPLVIAERSLSITSARNFRDIGGYRTTDGHWVRTGLVYRSNKLSSLTPAEQQKLLSQHLTLDVDLRNASERKEDPDALPPGIRYQVADVVSLSHGIGFHDPALITLAAALAAGLFSGSSDLGQSIGYPFMVNFKGADYAFHDLLTAVATNEGATVYHCSAGKDRTGWSTAVLLTLLGVPRATVEADFLASNTYTGDAKAVELSWLRAAFAEVDHLYGSFDAYLRKGLKLDDTTIASLRAKLLG
ncbi:tyrosine-protein phosphatase [Streptomyces beijiangensis]|uniref:Tyrosine-protein phosphatase n=1 Tax=Streptomyces beijiangensis TaxID=163361 RepID=A0A939F3F4_9ACTN|nr:tyrosine-protein phosphatase [Streptomyces beijiangensis]MBO0510372.1 tyrosine-protein phosphatase [Streptomyces beijiangensis]